MKQRVWIFRSEGEWQILGVFKSREDAMREAYEHEYIPESSWRGPELIGDEEWWTAREEGGLPSYIIGYDF